MKLLLTVLVFPGAVTLWIAILFGDVGVSLGVIGHAMKLHGYRGSPTLDGVRPIVPVKLDDLPSDGRYGDHDQREGANKPEKGKEAGLVRIEVPERSKEIE